MATFTVVDKDKDPLEPGEINAGSTVQVNEGDIFIIASSANDDIKFEAASGSETSFEIQINASNNDDFSIEINNDLSASIDIADNVDVADVDIKAKDAGDISLTAGDNVSLGKFEGSETGSDSLVIGANFTTTQDIKTNGGDDSITIGDGASVKDIHTGSGDDTIDLGNDLQAVDIKMGDGADEVSFGDGATVHNIDTGKDDDTITIGDDLVANDIKTGDGDDSLSIGDFATIDDINTEKGDDTVVLGDDFTGDKVETKDGDDIVIVGSGGVIDDLDGGNGSDTLNSDTDFPGATNFETICFAEGTLIRTSHGEVPVEMLRCGDRVETLDHGMQRLIWIGSSVLNGHGSSAPVRIKRGSLGNTRDLWVSQQHRLLIGGWQVELLFGEPQVLVPAKQLVDGDAVQIVEKDFVNYFHILFDRHQIVFSESIGSESFHPGSVGMATLSVQSREEIYSIIPALRSDPAAYGKSARPSLRSREGQVLAAVYTPEMTRTHQAVKLSA